MMENIEHEGNAVVVERWTNFEKCHTHTHTHTKRTPKSQIGVQVD